MHFCGLRAPVGALVAGLVVLAAGSSFAQGCRSGNERCAEITIGPLPELTPAEKEAARRRAAAGAAREQRIRDEMRRLGAHREAEIRRRFEMQERAAAARPASAPGMPSAPPPCQMRVVREKRQGSINTQTLSTASAMRVPMGARITGPGTCSWVNFVIGEPRRTDIVPNRRGYICTVPYERDICVAGPTTSVLAK